MARPERPEGKPESEDETKQLPSVSTETAEFIALDPSDDPVAEIASPSFQPAFRGYDRRAVDDYVRRVTEIIAELHASRSPRAAVKRALDRVGRETAGILQNARDTADEITVQSSQRAQERVTEAEREAARLRSEAEAHVRALDAATDEIWVERRRIVESTNKLGERLQTIAHDAASDFPADTPNGSKGEQTPAAKPPPEKPTADKPTADKPDGKPVNS